MSPDKIREAIGLAYTHPTNEKKVLDTDLADSIAMEIEKVLQDDTRQAAPSDLSNEIIITRLIDTIQMMTKK